MQRPATNGVHKCNGFSMYCCARSYHETLPRLDCTTQNALLKVQKSIAYTRAVVLGLSPTVTGP